MGRESRDGGCRTSPLLVTEDGNFIVSGDDGGGGSSGEVLESGGDSAATAVLVLSTLVTVCASYTFGAAVRTILFFKKLEKLESPVVN